MATYLNNAQIRNFQKWQILGNYIWPNYYIGNTYQEELSILKDWLSDRIIWLDNNIPGICYNPINTINAHNLNEEKNIIKITDILGRENTNLNQPILIIYENGEIEKKMFLNYRFK